jgi:Rad3-related DNA helicase
LSELVQDLDFVLKAEDREFVYWVSRESGRRESLCTFQAAPIDIGPLLLESLFHVKDSVIMVSGTLAMGQSFDFFKQRVGLDRLEGRKARELLLGSCFDLKNQAVLVVPSFLPEPDYQATDFGSELAGVLIDIFKASRGRGLVLCTSYALLEEIYPLLKRGLEPDSILVLA